MSHCEFANERRQSLSLHNAITFTHSPRLPCLSLYPVIFSGAIWHPSGMPVWPWRCALLCSVLPKHNGTCRVSEISLAACTAMPPPSSLLPPSPVFTLSFFSLLFLPCLLLLLLLLSCRIWFCLFSLLFLGIFFVVRVDFKLHIFSCLAPAEALLTAYPLFPLSPPPLSLKRLSVSQWQFHLFSRFRLPPATSNVLDWGLSCA